ncbi:hypothetical protein Tco_0653731 [Tanacetum coccineum]|uniref:Integrase, catalytic region, zinc finger, CCHC-type, peptidase aspartic, catalytic n=1 Tax=Tanacetum coccineum TaxID=301880 RepID=A0ABQ4X1C8_9ASTR
MLDSTDFASWQKRIQLYCQGKENGVNILKSIDEGPFQMGTIRDKIAEGPEDAPGRETIHDYYVQFAKLINDMWNIKLTMSKMQLNLKFVNNMLPEWGRFVIAVKLNRGLRDSNYDQLRMGVALDEEQLLFIVGGQDTAVDEYVDEQPTLFMVNLSSADPVYDEASPSYDSDILSEVHDNDHYQDIVFKHHEVHEMHDDVQPNYVVDSYSDYTSDSNMISYDQYVKDNAVLVVQSNVSSVPNDAYMMILNDIYEPSAQCVSVTT